MVMPVSGSGNWEEWQVHLAGSLVVEQLNFDADIPSQLYKMST